MRHILFGILVISIFFACSGKKKSDKLKDSIHVDELVVNDQSNLGGNSKMVYRVPTPIEFYVFYKNAGGDFHNLNLMPVEDESKYLTSKEKAIAFGIYASDLAYSAVFEQNQSTISYFETAKTLADELGFTEGYGENLMNRFKKNLNNVDSLYNLTADSYWSVFSFLEDQDKTILLSYITIAGWIESLYQAFGAIDKYEHNELIHCLADQQYVIENLHAYVNEVHNGNEKNDEVLGIIEELLQAYEVLYENDADQIMTEDQFNEIRRVVVKNRNLLVK